MSILHCAILYYPILLYTVIYDITLYHNILYYTILYTLPYLSVSYLTLAYLTFPRLTLPCLTLLYFTLHYLISPGVTASEVAIDIMNALQEVMLKCSKMLWKFDSGITYKFSRNAHLGPALLSVRALHCKHCVRTKHTSCRNIFNHSHCRKLLYTEKTQCKHDVASQQ